MLKNPKFNTNLLRNKNLNKLRIEIENKLKKKSKYWVKIFKENKIPHSTINNVEDVIKPTDKEKKNDFRLQFDSIEGLKISGNPLKFSFLDINKNSRKSPNLDENRMEILKKLIKFNSMVLCYFYLKILIYLFYFAF